MLTGKNNQEIKYSIREVKTSEDFAKVENFKLKEKIGGSWLDKAREDNNCMLLAAIDDSGNCIGELLIQTQDKERPIEADGKTKATLRAINVAEELRQEGIGVKLENKAEEILRDQGFECVTIGAHTKDPNNPNNPDLFDIYQNKWLFNEIIGETKNEIGEVISRVFQKNLVPGGGIEPPTSGL